MIHQTPQVTGTEMSKSPARSPRKDHRRERFAQESPSGLLAVPLGSDSDRDAAVERAWANATSCERPD